MKLSELTPETVERSMADFYDTVSKHVAELVYGVSSERYSIPRERRRLGANEYPYYCAPDIHLVLSYARGEMNASGRHVEELCQRLLDLLLTAPAGRLQEDWGQLGKTPLGVGVLAARARRRLREDSETLSREEVLLLSGLSPQKIGSARLAKTGSGSKIRYSSAAVRKFFEREGVPV